MKRTPSLISISNAAVAVIFIAFSALSTASIAPQSPQQIHLSLGSDVTEMTVMWSTMAGVSQPVVKYIASNASSGSTPFVAQASSHNFTDAGAEKHWQIIHRALMINLTSDTTYNYTVGSSDGGFSDTFTFTTLKDGSNWQPRFGIYGDMGRDNAMALPLVQQEVSQGLFDVILHVGDFAYDLDTDNGRVGDDFMNSIQDIAANIPYMTCPGNHESGERFSHYINRFSMPNSFENMFYSFNVGPVHVVSFSTEYLFYGWEDPILASEKVLRQYEFLEDDLRNANKHRDEQPWIITMAHRPPMCASDDNDGCLYSYDIVRQVFERIFYEHGVDLEIWAHEHNSQLTWPVFDLKVHNGSLEEPYTNPNAPVHLVTGAGGCPEDLDKFIANPPEFWAKLDSDYAYTRLQALNSSHLYFEQVSADKNGQVLFSVNLIKDKHGPYTEELAGMSALETMTRAAERTKEMQNVIAEHASRMSDPVFRNDVNKSTHQSKPLQ